MSTNTQLVTYTKDAGTFLDVYFAKLKENMHQYLKDEALKSGTNIIDIKIAMKCAEIISLRPLK
jgi:hypothetical protein